jgi:exopolysaccharide biosynthesis polyprenyl glycosylphosphotransferase
MSTLDVGLGERTWSPPATAGGHARAERLLPVLGGLCLLLGDASVVLAAFAAAYWARFVLPDVEIWALPVEQYVRMGLTVTGVSLVLFALQGLYDQERPLPPLVRIHHIVSGLSTAIVIAMALSFFVGDQRFSRLWFAAGWAFAIVGVACWRIVAQRAYRRARAAFAPTNRVAIVGANPLGADLAAELAGRYRVVGYVDNGSDIELSGELPLLGAIAELEHIVQANSIDELVVALPADRREQVERMIARGFGRRVRVKFLPEVRSVALLPERLEVHRLGGRPYLGFATAAHVGWTKRALDLTVTTLALMVLAPVLLAIAVAIKFDSTGPILYRQVRVGRHGRRFNMLKFRSMRQDADQLLEQLRDRNEVTGPLFKMREDPRVTRVGRLLRRWSLDELPQLLNVLKGEMSLVGPRPPLPDEVARYEDWEFGRLRTTPGITGLWQVSGRSEVPFHDMVRLDIHYIRTWSLGLDLEILARTIPAVLSSRGAY